MKRGLIYLTSLLCGFLLSFNVLATTTFSSVYVFGDSLSDAGSNPSAVLSIYNLLGGNCDPSHPCPPYVDGHFSNGPTAAEYLANSILPGGANPTNFFSFAVAGATSGIGNYGDGGSALATGSFGLPGMQQELGKYLSLSGGSADPTGLYFVWGGANDFLTFDSPIIAAQNIASHVVALANIGATHILIPNLPDLSLTPFIQDEGLIPQAQAFSLGFNAELASLIDGLNPMFPSVDIIEFDTFSVFNNVVTNPELFGFSDAHSACLSLLFDACANPDEHLFWDGLHPTSHAHVLISSAIVSAIPEPETYMMLLVGLGFIGFISYRMKETTMKSGSNINRVMYVTRKG
ncbi:SGNH/GDSL hydrolase family protein [Nitrosomonas sp.]|uniref:SGNH/GDSL hydrolase family protein n=1 Tax=Nitrosomonas sp. TaxID=42353 RepID=UPI0025CF71AB|nr:SGNH/GDSL hydrolase family protein [Nitrosomonas sp.]